MPFRDTDIPSDCNLVVVLGPTASGKTHYAVQLASRLDAEIVSADSRQVYRGMDIGTGKDLSEYTMPDGRQIPCHLIDICQAGTKYNVYEYQRDFVKAFNDIRSRGKQVILCGGTGLYIEAVLKAYPLVAVPENPALRKQLASQSLEELTVVLAGYKQRHGDSLHNQTDVDTVKRAIRAIEIEDYYEQHADQLQREADSYPRLTPYIIGLDVDRETRRRRITARLHQRLEQGMVEEVRGLLDSGIAAEDLIYYGLEYKYLTLYVTGRLSYEQMVAQLETAIHQFAKRQMTWFRGMERRGLTIHWLRPENNIQ
ncbi:MAG: tRNA (adenosine(37)-N6)-dimethylallyltransferase MiaA [Bacteroidales bacterium]|nr:tRNA (adenosine(37)-N6)-dimethylallyltransferase MiaA [Bacteroidales bacterium]